MGRHPKAVLEKVADDMLVEVASTIRVCVRCGPRPLYRFRPQTDAKGRTYYSVKCNSCWSKSLDLVSISVVDKDDPDQVRAENPDPFRHKPRPAPSTLENLPDVEPHGLCPKCSREWPVFQRCRGYKSTFCDRFVPHYHVRCITCAVEVLQRDRTRRPSLPVNPTIRRTA